MGSFFKFGQAVPEIFEFQCSKKWGSFRQDLGGTYMSKMGPERKFLKAFLQFSGNKTLITLSKMTQNLKIRAQLFDTKFYGAWDEKNVRSQSFDIWPLGPKNQFSTIWAQSYWQRTNQAILIKNPSSNFHKVDLIFSRIIR